MTEHADAEYRVIRGRAKDDGIYCAIEKACAIFVGVALFAALGGLLVVGIGILIAWSRGTLLLIPIAIGLRGLFRSEVKHD